ncbi:uncharacterized protein [Nicotiana sylvestris]|uniref:uncharacterized protein n=1 Tax=Nicotiana sylvestris TaxID=4096 RepID=UPI00388CBEBA
MEESDVAQGMTRIGRVYTPEHLGGASKGATTRKHVIEIGPDDLWRKVQAKEYSVIDHLNKIAAQISILSLLQNSGAHKNAKMKVLSEAYVPNNITGREMANMVGQVLESHKIVFHEDELPPGGVLVYGGSSLNICPLDTLKRMDKGFHDIQVGSMNVKAFDGSQRATIREINLCLQMGLTWFDVEFKYTWKEYNDWSPPWRRLYYPLEKTVPRIDQAFHQADIIWGTAEEEALARLMNLFLEDEDMNCSAIIEEEEEEGLTIQTMKKGVVLTNWTSTPSRAHRFPGIIVTFLYEPVTVTCNEAMQYKNSDSDEEDEIPEEVVREVKDFENKPKSNLDETEVVNLGDIETIKETRISIHLLLAEKEEDFHFLKEYEDIFAWSYDDMTDCFTGYHQIWIDEEDVEKTTFIIPWRVYCYKMMPFGLKNVGATYMRAMTTIFYDMIHNKIEVFVDGVIIKSKRAAYHIADLRKFFDRLRRYNLKLNPAKCAFGVPAGKLLDSFRVIAQSTVICEPIFKMLRKDAETSWTEECQKDFDKIKEPHH